MAGEAEEVASVVDELVEGAAVHEAGGALLGADEVEDEQKEKAGRMLSGDRLTPEALKHAERLIKMAAQS